jgi:hypothetical protein
MHARQPRERYPHPKPTALSDFILGSQDGIVNVLGIILGLSAATRNVRIILVRDARRPRCGVDRQYPATSSGSASDGTT